MKKKDANKKKKAAIRELREETGLTCSLFHGNGRKNSFKCHYMKGKVPKTVKYWVGLVPAGEKVKIQPDEVLDSVWLPLDKASAQITYASAKQLFNEVVEAIQSNALVNDESD